METKIVNNNPPNITTLIKAYDQMLELAREIGFPDAFQHIVAVYDLDNTSANSLLDEYKYDCALERS